MESHRKRQTEATPVATDTDLRKLKRVELLKVMVSLSEENDQLKAENAELKHQLSEKSRQLQSADMITDVSARLDDVYRKTQENAEAYLASIAKMEAETRERYQRMLADAQSQHSLTAKEERSRVEAIAPSKETHTPIKEAHASSKKHLLKKQHRKAIGHA